ncbi:MAG: molecular chaperone TorD family protein [Chloroflexota bacterium]|nr:molecular chaperone TorD family protein [Chloroflexota bacterium]
MPIDSTTRRVLALFAQLLDYPTPGLDDAARECAALVAPNNLDATTLLREFQDFVIATPQGQLEEIYTGVFELNAAFYPYVGYHLFGETYKRSVFLLELKQRYAAHGFDAGAELADHVAVLLRFVSVCDDAMLSEEILRDALLPTLDKMCGKEENELEPDDAVIQSRGRAAYQQLLRALRFAAPVLLSEISTPIQLQPALVNS